MSRWGSASCHYGVWMGVQSRGTSCLKKMADWQRGLELKTFGIALALSLACSGIPTGFAQTPAEAVEKSRQATALVQSGKAEEAIPMYLDLVKAFPAEKSFRVNLAIAEYKAERYRDAVEACNSLLRMDPDLFPAWLFLGASQLKLGEAAEAEPALQRALAMQPADINARLMLADAQLALEQYPKAAENYRRASEMMPDSPRGWFGLANAYEGLTAGALGSIERSAPGSAELFALSAEVAFDKGQLAQPFQLYRQALKLEPSFRGVHSAIAEIYRLSAHPEWAAVEAALEPRTPPDCANRLAECQFSARALRGTRGDPAGDNERGVLEGQGSPRVVEAGPREAAGAAAVTRKLRGHGGGTREERALSGGGRSVEAGTATRPRRQRHRAAPGPRSMPQQRLLLGSSAGRGSVEARTLVSRKQLSVRAGARRNTRFRGRNPLPGERRANGCHRSCPHAPHSERPTLRPAARTGRSRCSRQRKGRARTGGVTTSSREPIRRPARKRRRPGPCEEYRRIQERREWLPQANLGSPRPSLPLRLTNLEHLVRARCSDDLLDAARPEDLDIHLRCLAGSEMHRRQARRSIAGV